MSKILNKNHLIIFTLALCSIIYEMGFAYGLTLIYGSDVFYYSLTIGIYIFSMGLGTFFFEKLKHIKPKKLYLINEILLSFFSLLAIPIMFYLVTFLPELYYLNHIFIYTIIIIIGILSGLEIPIVQHINNDKFVTLLGIDYFGTLIGTLLFSLLLLPNFGLVDSIYLTIILNIIMIIIMIADKKTFIIGTLFIATLLYGIFIFHIGKIIEDIYIYKIIEQKECINKPCKVSIIDNKYTKYQNFTYVNLHFPKSKKVKKKFDIKCMYIDKEVQFCDNWAYSYHHFLVDVPINIIRNMEKNQKKNVNKKLNVLLLGGGDFYAATFLINNNVNLTHIDIDKQFDDYVDNNIVHHVREKLLKLKNYKFINTDAFIYLGNIKKKYDLIVFDLPILKNQKLLPLYSKEMYLMLYLSLKNNGILVDTYEGKDKYIDHTLAEVGFKYQYIYNGFMYGIDSKNPINQYFSYSDSFTFITKKDLNIKDPNFTKLTLKKNNKIRTNQIFRPNYKYIIKNNY